MKTSLREMSAYDAAEYSPVDIESNDNEPRMPWRKALLAATIVAAVLAVAGLRCMRSTATTSNKTEFPSDPDDIVGLSFLGTGHPGCSTQGAVCICDGYGVQKKCREWVFKVGDVMIFGRGPATTPMLAAINMAMEATGPGAVHAAIITEVRGPNMTDIIVTECLKEPHLKILQSNMEEVLQYRQYHDVWIRRVDATRFPKFASRASAITQWANQRIGDPFDKQMLYPGIRITEPSFFPKDAGCDQRERALEMYRRGGPGKWICSQFAAWTLAFAGGLNTDYPGPGASTCAAPSWDGVVDFLEPSPNDLINQKYWDNSNYHVVCKPCRIDMI